MYNFILQFLIMVSLATIIYLIARAIPRINENIVLGMRRNSFFDQLFTRLQMEKIDEAINKVLEKILRKIKIIIMKVDNILTKHLKGFKIEASKEKDLRPNIFSAEDGSASGGEGSVVKKDTDKTQENNENIN